jgi:mannose-6-phosphate isomerase
MNKLYPLKFKPIFRDKIWGGQKIKTKLGMDFGNLPNCGEVWVASGVEGFVSTVENGFLEGNELNELVEVYMDELVGESVYRKFGDEFPLLIKYIDASDWLSIQVHPDDALAARRKIGYGKTEMWYIMDADKDAELISGFNKEIDRDIYQKTLAEGTIREIMQFDKVKKGDVYLIPAGRVHALGPGVMLAEIQQTSDTTYRIYDWDRIDANGMTRELHTDEALDAIDYSFSENYKTDYEEVLNHTTNLVDIPMFTTNLVSLDTQVMKNYQEMDSFVIYLGIDGEVELDWGEGTLLIKPGDAVVKPASLATMQLKPQMASKLLEVYIK